MGRRPKDYIEPPFKIKNNTPYACKKCRSCWELSKKCGNIPAKVEPYKPGKLTRFGLKEVTCPDYPDCKGMEKEKEFEW